MRTKVNILCQEPKAELKPIEFVKYINRNDFSVENTIDYPSRFNSITLIEKSYYKGLDLMYCVREGDGNIDNGYTKMILGRFNDGIVDEKQ